MNPPLQYLQHDVELRQEAIHIFKKLKKITFKFNKRNLSKHCAAVLLTIGAIVRHLVETQIETTKHAL